VTDRTRPDGRLQNPLAQSPPKLNPVKPTNRATAAITVFILTPYLIIILELKIPIVKPIIIKIVRIVHLVENLVDTHSVL
jgi:hypothetical protein